MTEIWKDIPGFEGAYQVSDQGRVRSLDRLADKFGAHPGHINNIRRGVRWARG